MEQLQKWRKPDGTLIRVPIEDEIRSVLIKEKYQGNHLKVCIGTDSQVKARVTEFATVIVFLRKGKGGFMYVDLEVHADINTNPNFKSNDALKEAMGYIVGMGFAFKAKPDAFASSACANKMVQ